jgi:hypothetical protein
MKKHNVEASRPTYQAIEKHAKAYRDIWKTRDFGIFMRKLSSRLT